MPKLKNDKISILWLTQGLGCDGCSISMTAATNPSLEQIVQGILPDTPEVNFHHPILAYENADQFMETFYQAAENKIGDFILVIEGSIPNEEIVEEGCWAGFGNDKVTGQPIPTCDWIDKLSKHAWAILAAGTCATNGGIHAMEGNPTGCMGISDYLGEGWKSKDGMPIVCMPGCPIHPDNFMETLHYLLKQYMGSAPMISLDKLNRPKWLFEQSLHENCNRGGYYEQGEFAQNVGEKTCIVKQGCWGPVVDCNVGKRGWINGVGGCPSVGGICIACTMPGFPDKFMPFQNEPPGAIMSTAAVSLYGKTIKSLRAFTQEGGRQEPDWRKPSKKLESGHETNFYKKKK